MELHNVIHPFPGSTHSKVTLVPKHVLSLWKNTYYKVFERYSADNYAAKEDHNREQERVLHVSENFHDIFDCSEDYFDSIPQNRFELSMRSGGKQSNA
eukprot:979455-Amphidinium_carterae.1